MNENIKALLDKFLGVIKSKQYKYGFILILIVISTSVAVPVIVNIIYLIGYDGERNTAYSAGDILSFYGSILAFLGTISLGSLAVSQNKKLQQITNRTLTLEENRNKPVLEVTPQISIKNYQLPFIEKAVDSIYIHFCVLNSSENPAFNVETTDLWIASAHFDKENSVILPPKDKTFIDTKTYGFHGYLKPKDTREFSSWLDLGDKEKNVDINIFKKEKYYLGCIFTFQDCLGTSYTETTTMLIGNGEKRDKPEKIIRNHIEINRNN